MPKEKAILQPVPSSLNVISVANASNTSYSLAKDKESKRKQIFNLEKQASLADQLLNRAEDRQISQLVAKKKTCLEKKEVLQNAIQNIDQVQFLISQFKLLFEFVEAFSVFTISLLSSIEEEKVIRQKLASLKKTEKNLMALAPSESYFSSEAFGELNYFAYQAYIESYRKNFFLGLTSAGSQYNDYVLLAGEIRTCFGNAYLAITKDAFNLKSISAFLCRTISQLALPNSEYCLIGLWIYFFYTVLFAFVELKPITSNLDKIKLAVEFHAQVLAFNFKENYFHNLISLTRRFDTLEKKVADFFCQDKPLTTREESRVVLNFITKTHNEILIFEKKIATLLNSLSFLRMLDLVGKILHEKEAMDVLTVLKANTGLDLTLIKVEKLDFRYVKNHKDALRYFFYILYKEEVRCRVAECLTIVSNELGSFDSSEDILQLENLSIKEFITLSYCCFTIILYTDFLFSLVRFKDRLQSRGLYAVNSFFSFMFEKINEQRFVLTPKIEKFFAKKFSIESDFISYKKNLLEEIELLLSLFQEAVVLEEDGVIANIMNNAIYDIYGHEMNNFTEVLNQEGVSPSNLFISLQIHKEAFELKKKEIVSREFIKPIVSNLQIKKKSIPLEIKFVKRIVNRLN